MKQRQHWYSLLLTGSLIVAAAVALPPEGNGFFERVAAFVGGETADAEGPVFETEGSCRERKASRVPPLPRM